MPRAGGVGARGGEARRSKDSTALLQNFQPGKVGNNFFRIHIEVFRKVLQILFLLTVAQLQDDCLSCVKSEGVY